jgi:phosphoglycolate phosphatase/beta-phosphoglucomutase
MGYFRNPHLSRAVHEAVLVIFDMNGLIVDDEHLQLESVNQVLGELGIAISERYWVDNCVGSRAGEYFRRILREHGIAFTPEKIRAMTEDKNAGYRTLMKSRTEDLARPGAVEFIKRLESSPAHRLGLATSAHTKEIDIILGPQGLGLLDLFSFVVHGEEVTEGKPHPEGYLLMLEKSRFSAQRCLVLEDSGAGVAAAAGAGIPCIACPNRFTLGQDFSPARFVVDSLTPEARIVQPGAI